MKRLRKWASENGAATLRTVADHVGLAPCSVSAILNNSQAADAIPSRTKERVQRATKQLKYRPNLAARSLRTRRSYLVALVASDLGNARTARIIAGVEGFLSKKGYLLVTTTCARTHEDDLNSSSEESRASSASMRPCPDRSPCRSCSSTFPRRMNPNQSQPSSANDCSPWEKQRPNPY